MSTVRHWKQRFDPDADLVFRKRMIVRSFGIDVAQPGDPVPESMKIHFGKHRLKIWWEGGFLSLAEPTELEAPSTAADGVLLKQTGTGSPKDPAGPVGTDEVPDGDVHVGGGYYNVTRGGVTTRIRGKKNIPV